MEYIGVVYIDVDNNTLKTSTYEGKGFDSVFYYTLMDIVEKGEKGLVYAAVVRSSDIDILRAQLRQAYILVLKTMIKKGKIIERGKNGENARTN